MSTSSMICKNFAQNAWKKDLCSNCFKSEVEHWPTKHININEDMNEKSAQKSANNSSIKMNIKNMQISIKNDCNSTTTILKKSSNPSPQVINSPKKSPNHVSSQPLTLINGNKDFTKSNCNEVTLQRKKISEENNETIIIKDIQKFPQKEKLLTTNNRNNSINNIKSQQSRERNKNMPLIGILKSTTTQDLIKYRPKTKCLVFKEGDPLIIGYGIDKTDNEYDIGYDGSDNSDEDEVEEDSEDDDDDDDDYEECFSSDDKQLRELTRENTKFNSNFANFAVSKSEDKNKQMYSPIEEKPIDNKPTSDSRVCQPINNESIPKVCEKLVQIGLNETMEAINHNNHQNSDNKMQSNESIYSTVCEMIPMSTSSDSSSDEKEDMQQIDENFGEVLNSMQVIDDSSEQSVDTSETDNSSTTSEISLEEKQKSEPQLIIEPNKQKAKPILPIKPNIFKPKPILKTNTDNKDKTEQKLTEELYDESGLNFEENYLPQIVSDHIYQEILENEVINGKVINKSHNNNNNNNNTVSEKPDEFTANEKREIKLAELAQELELVRHLKRPAPQPPRKVDEEDLEDEDKNKLFLNSVNRISINDKHSSQSTSNSKTKFSIKKLLHKKASNDKNKDQPQDSIIAYSSDSGIYPMNSTSNQKAWKKSDFDRTNLTIIHPIDLVMTKSQDNYEVFKDSEVKSEIITRPEAPPRTPKPVRPSVPMRKKTKLLTSPTREPPPPPERSIATPPVNLSIKSTLTEAYNQLAKSNYNNLFAIKNKIESQCNSQYKWSDFEIGEGLKSGSAMIYKDSIISISGASVNLLVLPNCYSTPIVHQFRHHEDLVLMLDHSWTTFHLLDDLKENPFEQKQTNSLILQLYTILENCENNNCNQLPSNAINSIIICSSVNDILLIVPLNSSSDQISTSYITLHQFLSQVLEKLLPNSLFESVGHVLCQQTISISHSKMIVQLIAFQTPVDEIDCEVQINYWFDISRCKFINQFCVNESKLTQLDYIYLQFLCNNNARLIRNAVALMINSK